MGLIISARAASADVTLKDVQTIMRTIGFLETAPASNATMAIIYNPDDGASARDANKMKGLIKSEKNGLRPHLVPISNIGQLQNAKFAFLTSGLQPYYKNISTALHSNKILSFTLDRACVDQDYCTVYINSEQRVKIIIKKSNADRINARFKPVFLMMVTVI